jgi:predicted dehydrogenase
MATVRPLRFGLAGTGHWARITHAPALAGADGIEFAAVWGRNREAAGSLAAAYRVRACSDFDDFLAGLDAVAFSVPPDVQSAIAVRAARAGKHLLLEKPVAIAETSAEALARAVDEAGVATVVFFTARFRTEVRSWLAGIAGQGPWAGGTAVWLGSAQLASSPFNTPWRRDKGGLWDLAPHAVSLLWACLGPVTSVTADSGRGDVSCLVLHHEGGATSTVTVTLAAPEAAEGFELQVWGANGRSAAPGTSGDSAVPLRLALAELAGNARSGHLAHPCDVHFGVAVGRVLASAQRQIDARRLA